MYISIEGVKYEHLDIMMRYGQVKWATEKNLLKTCLILERHEPNKDKEVNPTYGLAMGINIMA